MANDQPQKSRLDRVERILDRLAERQEQSQQQFDQRLDRLAERQEQFQQRLEQSSTRLDRIESLVESNSREIASLTSELRQQALETVEWFSQVTHQAEIDRAALQASIQFLIDSLNHRFGGNGKTE